MMKMRRFRQQIPIEESKELLKISSNGVLALIDSDGKPYGVPMSFVYDGVDSIYFHSALSGRKIDCVRNNPNVCFTVIANDEIHPEDFTTYFKSVIVEGVISMLFDEIEIISALRLLSSKYSPGLNCESEIEKGLGRVSVLKLKIDSITGKEAIELTKRRISLNSLI